MGPHGFDDLHARASRARSKCAAVLAVAARVAMLAWILLHGRAHAGSRELTASHDSCSPWGHTPHLLALAGPLAPRRSRLALVEEGSRLVPGDDDARALTSPEGWNWLGRVILTGGMLGSMVHLGCRIALPHVYIYIYIYIITILPIEKSDNTTVRSLGHMA
jgi:hypothetical protein